MINVFLCSRIGEGKAQWQFRQFLILVVGFNKLLQTVGDVFPKLLRCTRLQLLRHTILGLGDVESALLFRQSDLTDTQISTAHVQSEEGSLLVAIGESHDPGHIHGLERRINLWIIKGEVKYPDKNSQCYPPRRLDLIRYRSAFNLSRNDQLKPTLFELLHEMVRNLLEFGAVHGKDVLELLDLLQQVLGQLMHRSCRRDAD